MAVYFIYAGRQGGGLESTLALYETALKLKIDAKLVLSEDNQRRDKVKKLYPETRFYNFYSPAHILAMKNLLKGGTAFFAMVSPKVLPLFTATAAKKIFYFHATFDYSFQVRTIPDALNDWLQDFLIRNSNTVVATQWPLAWQIRLRQKKEATELPHPPYSVIRKGFFEEDELIEMPFERFFLAFGGIDRFSKGTDLLLQAADGSGARVVLVGKRRPAVSKENIHHINHWLGDGQLHHLIKQSECTLLPYLVPSQFSGCLALSFYFGKPVIASNLPTFEGWVDEGKTGWFFPSGDASSLRNKMQDVWSRKARYSKTAIIKKQEEMEKKTRSRLKELLEQTF